MSNHSEIQQLSLAFKLIGVRKSLNDISEQIKELDATGKNELYKKVIKDNGLIDPKDYNRYIVYEEKLNMVLDLVRHHSPGISFGKIKANSSLSSDQLEGIITTLLYTAELVRLKTKGSIKGDIILVTLQSYKKFFIGQKPILPSEGVPFEAC